MAEDGWVQAVHRFWFEDLRPAQWWKADPALDAAIRERFADLHARIRAMPPVAPSPLEALSGVIVLDQFSRNMFRGTGEAFAYDTLARARAGAAIAAGFDHGLSGPERQFLYMPFVHSEDRSDQARALALFATVDVPDAMRSAEEHAGVIARFGRFPARNAALGRASTPEEVAYLAENAIF